MRPLPQQRCSDPGREVYDSSWPRRPSKLVGEDPAGMTLDTSSIPENQSVSSAAVPKRSQSFSSFEPDTSQRLSGVKATLEQ
jgi:hypothetical protein